MIYFKYSLKAEQFYFSQVSILLFQVFSIKTSISSKQKIIYTLHKILHLQL